MKELKLIVLILIIAYLAPVGTFFGMIPIMQASLFISIPYFIGCFILVIFYERILNWILK